MSGSGAGARVAGVVLAAGRSTRMGRSKALLPVGDTIFAARAVAALRGGGCDPVVAVVRPADAEAARPAVERAGGRIAVIADPAAEQIDSLRLGLEVAGPGAAGAAVLPADVALVDPLVVAALLVAFRARGAPIVRPVHEGRPGHPVVFARALWDELAAEGLAQGARDVVHRHHDDIEEIAVEDRGVVVDVDTPADYDREIGRAGER